MERIIEIVGLIAYLVIFLVGALTPLLILLLPPFAFIRARKWRWGVVFQAVASLFVWAVLSVVVLYMLFLNFASKFFGFADDAINRSEASYLGILIIVCLPYALINSALVCGLVYGIKLQVGRKDSDEPEGAI
jgi:hypothetical protein